MANQNLLQRIGGVLQAAGDPTYLERQRQIAEQQALQQQQQQNLQRMGNVFSQGLPLEGQIRQLAQIGTPEAIQAAMKLQETQLGQQITPYQQANLDLQRQEQQRLQNQFDFNRGIALEEAAFNRQREGRLQQQADIRNALMQSLTSGTDSGRVMGDIASTGGVKDQISQFKAQNKALSAGLLDPELKDFTRAQIEANNEEIKNLRELEKERREAEKLLTPEQAAKVSLVKKGQKDIQDAIDLLLKGDDKITMTEAMSMGKQGADVPFIGFLGTKGVPFTDGRKIRAKVMNAVQAQLRAESGAAVPEEEVERAAERFLPTPLDTAQGRIDKLRSLQELLNQTDALSKQPSFMQQPALATEPRVIDFNELAPQ